MLALRIIDKYYAMLCVEYIIVVFIFVRECTHMWLFLCVLLHSAQLNCTAILKGKRTQSVDQVFNYPFIPTYGIWAALCIYADKGTTVTVCRYIIKRRRNIWGILIERCMCVWYIDACGAYAHIRCDVVITSHDTINCPF